MKMTGRRWERGSKESAMAAWLPVGLADGGQGQQRLWQRSQAELLAHLTLKYLHWRGKSQAGQGWKAEGTGKGGWCDRAGCIKHVTG